MHPRNIYKTPPNFAELKKMFPEFAEKVHVDVTGKLRLDFTDPEAVRILTICCLKKDFTLDVQIPKDRLMPYGLSLRINYILWMEDLLDHCGIKENIIGIDIGTGSCCIYCLLSVRMNKHWKMFGLEIDKLNIKYATDNISRNKLQEKIQIIDQEGSAEIFNKLFSADSGNKTFTICNPPFYSSKEELEEGENRTGKRRKLDHENRPQESVETVYETGEFGFVSKIFNESLELKDKISIYSSMFGCKKNFQKFISLLQSHKIDNFTTTDFVQGKISRWAVAWSFSKKLSSFKSESEDQQKINKPNILKHTIKDMSFEDAHVKLLNIFTDLKMSTKLLKGETNKLYQYEISVTENTWSNQRRKKRAQQRNEELGTSSSSQNQHLRMGFEVGCIGDEIQIQMFFIEGSMSKDAVNQILQYVKNNLKT